MRIIITLVAIVLFFSSCEDMYHKQSLYEGEIVYPAKYDTIIGTVGFERVEIDLLKAGRLNSDQIRLGKAKFTRIKYDDVVIDIDSLVSYVEVKNLTQSKLYRFQVHTVDEFGNESVPQEVALIPFTQSDLENYAVAYPRILASPSAAIIDWPKGISSSFMTYHSLEYEYVDKDGVTRKGERGEDSRFFIGNVQAGQTIEINMVYNIIPIINRMPLLDTVAMPAKLLVNMPTASTEFIVSEKDILEANGVTVFTAEAVSGVNKLTYPVHANSLADVFYFPDLKILDLTGGDLFMLPELKYDRNSTIDYVGGGEYSPFMRKAGDISLSNQQTVRDLLEAGILEKVYYIPNSMGLDDMLEPYISSGVVELVEGPESVLIDHQFYLDGNVQSSNFNVDLTFPATDAPAGDNLENVYKVVLKARSASLVFALPKEYEFKAEDYRYLKFKVYAPDKSSFSGPYVAFQKLWPRFMNRMWSFGSNSAFGMESWWDDRTDLPIEDSELLTWKDVTIDMSRAIEKHTRVFILNIGGEPSASSLGGSYDPPVDIVYYFANIRFSKNP